MQLGTEGPQLQTILSNMGNGTVQMLRPGRLMEQWNPPVFCARFNFKYVNF
jgi:hypothetical protein